MNKNFQALLFSLTDSNEVLNEELIQELWSGYGQLTRVTLNNQSIIIKLIKFPEQVDHPRGWNSNLSHERKVKSYQIETTWYKNYNHEIENAYFPKYISSGEISNTKYLILEDLQEKGFKPQVSIQWSQISLCLKWLAYFHAKNLDNKANELWKIGTYWHLDTRPDELQALNDNELITAAPVIDEKLNNARFKTIVHGDAKLANFLFNESEVSAVDFQYVGGGVGVKDLAYFLSSIYNENELIKNEKRCLDNYFFEFKNAMKQFNKHIDAKLIEQEWRELYPYAWCDFYRFLKGWSPAHFKINTYSEQMKERVLNAIRQK
ncbi:MAG: serine/threonine protein kinase [Bacteriovoracaceae bacterium]|jgi:serine/threonine protein kinase